MNTENAGSTRALFLPRRYREATDVRFFFLDSPIIASTNAAMEMLMRPYLMGF